MNVGTEEEKGNELTKATRALFHHGPFASRFVGNVEGRDIYEGHARVVVCEGFVGNVLLKAGEGAVEFLFSALKQEFARLFTELPPDVAQTIAGQLKDLKTRFEYQEFGGGPLARHPRRVHHLPRFVEGSRDQERAPRRRPLADDTLNARIIAQLAAGAGGSATA